MERLEAIRILNTLVGQDLRLLADRHGITVLSKKGNKNKGWAGHTIERYLGLALNSSQSPDFGSWELKLVPLIIRKGTEELKVKETMAITMINPGDVENKEFEESHLLTKLQKMVVVAQVVNQADDHSLVHSVASFDLDNPQIYEQVKADYNLVRETIITQGFSKLSGTMGQLVQPRTKGPKGSKSRAFYARTSFVAHILGEGYSVPLPVKP